MRFDRVIIGVLVISLMWITSTVMAQTTSKVPAKGGDIVAIVVGEAPNAVQTASAKDLQRIFKSITGREVAITSAAQKGRCLFIGCAPASEKLDSKLSKLGTEGLYLSISPRRIICAGKDPRGTYYAVQELLYRIGCRWLWPGQYGECLPAKGPINMPNLELLHTPDFLMRGGHCVQVAAQPGEEPKHIDVESYVEWAARNKWNRFKASYSRTWDYGEQRGGEWKETSGHTTTTDLMPAELFAQHPEWFSLVKGVRTALHPIGTTAFPCISNPAVVDHIVNVVMDYFAANPTAQRYFVGANDEPSYWCECDNCKRLDPVAVDWSKNGGKEDLPMTDRWLYLVNIIAERVEQKYPGKWIGTFAYGSTRSLPVKNFPRNNVMIEYTMWYHCPKHKFLDASCPENSRGLSDLKRWMAISPATSIYSYLDYYMVETPQAYWESDADYYRSLHKLGVRYISDEIDTSMEAAPVTLGYRARLLWDLETDYKSYLKELCPIAYGAAAGDLQRFWELQQEAVYRSPSKHVKQNDLPKYTPKMIKDSYRILNSAEKKKITPDQLARVERARMSMLFAEFYLAKEASGSGDLKVLAQMSQIKAEIYKLVHKYGFAINLAAWQPLGPEESSSATTAISGKQLVKLPDQWLFRTDPQKQGEPQRWFEPSADTKAYKPISVAEFWDKQWVGQYLGDAWYVTDVNIPASNAKHVWLLFGAIDDSWNGWLNGQPIGHSVGAPGDVWDKPVAVDIAGKYKPDAVNRIAIKVNNLAGPGGIWRSAMITTTE